MRVMLSVFILFAGLMGHVGFAAAEPTEIAVRVISLGAKFVGTSMGGAEIVLRDVQSGEVLAKGVTAGGTGDTKKIMSGGPRNQAVSDAGAAMFLARIDLTEPRLIQAEAFGPLAHPQAAVRVTAQQWVVPGGHITSGDGWVLEMPGLVVDVLDPPTSGGTASSAKSVKVTAHITMMCGCPIEPGGLWDAARFDVRAHVARDGTHTAKADLAYAGRTSRFSADIPLQEAGSYVVTVSAMDRQTGATGVDRISVTIP
jgi:hypothetical protein